MNVYASLAFLLGYYTVIAMGQCQLTPCAGMMISGQVVCNTYNMGKYSGRTSRHGCNWDSEMVECCPQTNCGIWSSRCYGINYSDSHVCSSEFPNANYAPTGRSMSCGAAAFKFECCPAQ